MPATNSSLQNSLLRIPLKHKQKKRRSVLPRSDEHRSPVGRRRRAAPHGHSPAAKLFPQLRGRPPRGGGKISDNARPSRLQETFQNLFPRHGVRKDLHCHPVTLCSLLPHLPIFLPLDMPLDQLAQQGSGCAPAVWASGTSGISGTQQLQCLDMAALQIQHGGQPSLLPARLVARSSELLLCLLQAKDRRGRAADQIQRRQGRIRFAELPDETGT